MNSHHTAPPAAQAGRADLLHGGVRERPIRRAWKARRRATASWVRIPPPPPRSLHDPSISHTANNRAHTVLCRVGPSAVNSVTAHHRDRDPRGTIPVIRRIDGYSHERL